MEMHSQINWGGAFGMLSQCITGIGQLLSFRSLAADGFDDQSHSNRLCAGPDAADPAVDQRPHGLNIGFELALGDPRCLAAHTAEVLRLAAARNRTADDCPLTGKCALTGHDILDRTSPWGTIAQQ